MANIKFPNFVKNHALNILYLFFFNLYSLSYFLFYICASSSLNALSLWLCAFSYSSALNSDIGTLYPLGINTGEYVNPPNFFASFAILPIHSPLETIVLPFFKKLVSTHTN